METTTIYKKLFEVKKAGIKLQRDTKAFNYKYATLSQIQEKLNPVFEKQKLLITHYVQNNEVYTTIQNIESEDKLDYIQSSIPLSEGVKAQDKGSEITYYRRYNLLSLLDLEVEDDDGKKAQESKVQEKKWLNYEDLVTISESGNTTEEEVAKVIKQDGFTLSKKAKEAVRHYVTTGEVDKNMFFNK